MDVWGATVCFNTVEAKKRGIPKPETWKDLAKPAFKGQVVMPSPASSGTGFFDVTAWLTLWGEKGGWDYMDKLHENIAQYTHSGSKPCNQAAAGEFVAGISFEYRGNSNKAKGAPIELVFPKEGLGWDLEAFAIHKGTKKLEAAKQLADWASSKNAMLLYGKNFAITAQPGRRQAAGQHCRRLRERLVKMVPKAAGSRERVLAEWTKRYNVKSEPRNSGVTQAGEPFLRLEGIRKDFGSFTALRDIRLEVAQGEFVCFLGPSGCGKTTLLRIIAGLEAQTEGSILQGGRDISALPQAQRDYGIVFQSYALFPNLSTFDNVAYGLVNRRTGREAIAARVAELLKLVGLPEAGDKYPSQLSGGEQQRIALARALATSPGLLLLVEPLSALDAIVRVHLRQEIRALQQRLGVTTIMVTHDQEEALSMADRIVVMNHGVIDQIGTPMEVYREPASPFVADFVGKVNMLTATVESPGRIRIGARSFACASCNGPVGRNVRAYLRPEDIVPRPIAAGDPNTVAGDPNVVDAKIEKIEFLGSYCLVRVAAEGLEGQPLTVYLSLNFLSEQGLRAGRPLRLRIRAERMRVFDA